MEKHLQLQKSWSLTKLHLNMQVFELTKGTPTECQGKQ